MKQSQKILLSIPSVLGFLFFITLMFPSEFSWLNPSMKAYYLQVLILQGLFIIQLIILLRRLWSYKNLDRAKKIEWTWLLILFSQITCWIYIWKKDDEFLKTSIE